MPLTKSAIKKQRVDKKRAKNNAPIVGRVKSALKDARTKPTAGSIKTLYASVDRAVAKGLVAKRTAARMKARLVKTAKATLTKSPFAK